MFLIPRRPPHATWQCWEGERLWAAATGIERGGATAQGWGGLGDFEPTQTPQIQWGRWGVARSPEVKGVP